MCKKWTVEEIEFLYKNADKTTIKNLAQILSRTKQAIRIKCNKLKIKYKKRTMFEPVGKTYGYLKVLSMCKKEKGARRTYYNCLCQKCNKKCVKVSTILSRAVSNTTCGCGQYDKKGYLHGQFTGYKEISGGYWSAIKRGAVDRQLEFNIDIKYAWKLFIKQNRKCALSNLDIDFPKVNNNPERKKATASLDRIDNAKGYIKGNVQWVHKEINLMKWTREQDRFIELCHAVSEHNKMENINE